MDGSLCSGPEGQCLRQEAEALFCEDVLHRAPFLSFRFDQATLGHVLEVSYKGSPLEGQAIGQFRNGRRSADMKRGQERELRHLKADRGKHRIVSPGDGACRHTRLQA